MMSGRAGQQAAAEPIGGEVLMMQYNEKQRAEMIEHIKGKTIVEMTYDDEGPTPYWTIELDDDSEFSFRFMAELVG